MRTELSEYTTENWDGDGAVALLETTVERAAGFVLALPRVERANVSVGYDGSIGMEWQHEEMTLFANIPQGGPIEIAFSLKRHDLRYNKKLKDDDPQILAELRPVLSYIESPPDLNFIVMVAYTVTPTEMMWAAFVPLQMLPGPGPKPALTE
ncbi:MAG TPA: hypothetical protein VHT05_02055 [Candidatus Elarobacter sp.]|nr:hypothetical protein [Candidatus Elarobacter sp.]